MNFPLTDQLGLNLQHAIQPPEIQVFQMNPYFHIALSFGGDTFNLKFKDLTSPNSVSAVGIQVIGYELQEK